MLRRCYGLTVDLAIDMCGHECNERCDEERADAAGADRDEGSGQGNQDQQDNSTKIPNDLLVALGEGFTDSCTSI